MPFASLTHNNCLRYGSIFLILILQVLLPIGSFCPASLADDKPVNTPSLLSQKQYISAKNYFYKVEHTANISQHRSNWLAGIRNFRRIYLADTKNELAPSCLYMMARMYRLMYKQFKLPVDIDEAIAYFNDVASFFPQSNLADDALFAIAEIEFVDKNKPAKAAKYYHKVIKYFPDGDKKSQSTNRLKELAKNYDIGLPEKLIPSLAAKQLINVLPVQYWSSNDYTRIVIPASAPIQYKTSLLEKNNNQPRRLYLDFKQSCVPAKFRSSVPIQDGLLKQVRTAQLNDTTVRVALDIQSISDYKIFNLKDPFRVVVDVHGAKKKKAKQASEKRPAVIPAPLKKNEPPKIQAVINTKKQQEVFITLKDQKKVRPATSTIDKRKAEKTVPSLAQQLGLGVRRIIIDPGHGGKDPGSTAYGLREKDLVLVVAKKSAAILKKKHNYDVILTRSSDTFLPLEERTAIANTKNADLFVSIHVNAHPQKTAKGVETFYLNLATNAEAMRVAALENATSTHNISELQNILSDLMQNAKINESSQLAEFVQASLVNGLKDHKYSVKNLGVKQAPFYVLIGAKMPAVLAEISFITNPKEASLLKNDNYLQAIAEQIAAGVGTYADHRKSAALQL